MTGIRSFRLRIAVTIAVSLTAAFLLMMALSITELRRAVYDSEAAYARALLDHLASMPAFHGEPAGARESLQTIAPYLASRGATIDLVSPEAAVPPSHFAWTRDLSLSGGSFVLRYRADPSRLWSGTLPLIRMHIIAGFLVLIVLLVLVGFIVDKSILSPLAAGRRQLQFMKRGGGWLASLPVVDAEFAPLYSAIRELGPALGAQVDEWLETDRRSHTALIFLQLNRRLHEPLRQAKAAASLLQSAAGPPSSLSEIVRRLEQHLETIASIISDEQENALSMLNRRDRPRSDS